MRFGKDSVSGQAAIEYVLVFLPLILILIFLLAEIAGFISTESGNGSSSSEVDQTRTGTIEGKYIDSADCCKHYYVTVRNGSYEADHEVSLAEYNAAQVGADFPIVLTNSDPVKAEETQEQADETKAQAAEQESRDDYHRWWLMNNQMIMNMNTSSE